MATRRTGAGLPLIVGRCPRVIRHCSLHKTEFIAQQGLPSSRRPGLSTASIESDSCEQTMRVLLALCEKQPIPSVAELKQCSQLAIECDRCVNE